MHHLDGNHGNNDPLNLVLIEHTDHMMLHGGRIMGRIGPPKRGPGKKTRLLTPEAIDRAIKRYLETRPNGA